MVLTCCLPVYAVQFPESLEERAKLLGDVQVKDIASIYRMQNVLGAGAQATVYQAVNKKSNRKVAVKVREQFSFLESCGGAGNPLLSPRSGARVPAGARYQGA